MTPADLAAWQGRLAVSDAEAARRLGLPYLTYRDYLPGGRRRQHGLPGWLPRLCQYIETFGPLPDAAGSLPFRGPKRGAPPVSPVGCAFQFPGFVANPVRAIAPRDRAREKKRPVAPDGGFDKCRGVSKLRTAGAAIVQTPGAPHCSLALADDNL